jgi:dipeptidyl aminopeptidase/acylaminoacyl peptidase
MAILWYTQPTGGSGPEVYFSRLGSPEARSLGLKNAKVPAISSKGDLAILLNHSVLAQMPFAGGVPREILERVRDADWTPDGSGLAVVHQNKIEFPIGTELYRSQNFISNVRFSPKGDIIAFIEMRPPGIGTVNVVDLNGKVKKLHEGDMAAGSTATMGLAFSPTGEEIWFGSRPKKGSGQILCKVTLAGQISEVLPMNGTFRIFDISEDGLILLRRTETRAGMVYFSAAEGKERDVSWLSGSQLMDISDDGKVLLFTENADRAGDPDRAGQRQLWKELSPPDPIGVHYVGPKFTPDGKTYAYAYWRTLADLYVIDGLK